MSINANTFRLDGRVALVTGSSTGIGLAIARGLGQAGATVVLNARNAGRLRETAAALTDEGLKVHVRACDVTDAPAVDAAVESIEHEVGPYLHNFLAFNASPVRGLPPREELLAKGYGFYASGALESLTRLTYRDIVEQEIGFIEGPPDSENVLIQFALSAGALGQNCEGAAVDMSLNGCISRTSSYVP